MKKNTISLLLIGAITLTTSCATLFTGTKQKITFKSNIDGVVYQNLKEIGKTNTTIKIKREDLVKLYTIKATGCPDKSIELPIKLNPAYIINIPFCFVGIGLLGAYLDAVNGADKKTSKVINVDLDCKTQKN